MIGRGNRPDFFRLRTLRELSRRETMAAVADALGISSSAVSQQIAQLEDEVGIPLVERRGRGVMLTPAGQRLVLHVGDRLQRRALARCRRRCRVLEISLVFHPFRPASRELVSLIEAFSSVVSPPPAKIAPP